MAYKPTRKELQESIMNANIVNNLIQFVKGERDMTGNQVKAATSLLKKILPDLSSTKVTGEVNGQMTLQVITGVPRLPVGQPMKTIEQVELKRIDHENEVDEIEELVKGLNEEDGEEA